MDFLGTDYGGWLVDLNLVPLGSTIISAGVGEDISFDLELIGRRKCNVIGIDPTKKSHVFIESQKGLKNFSLVKNALGVKSNDVVVMYQNNNPLHVSESILPNHRAVNSFRSYYAETIALCDLFERYNDISLIKLDIEGSEYSVLESLNKIPNTVKQLCIEFHHFCSDYTLEDTKSMIDKMGDLGFKKCYQKKPDSLAEITLVRV